ncbi:hypothetical protein ACFP8W_00115 [Nocardioides hankookensis]|uniref:Uncharacterized protein n=1 Tax=Nocardioides hankookensis TaxID=443157 RepID=A0ABW1LLN7_9ACTN
MDPRPDTSDEAAAERAELRRLVVDGSAHAELELPRQEFGSEADDVVERRPVWEQRSYSSGPEALIATWAGRRIKAQTGATPSPRVAEMLCVGVRAVLWVLGEDVGGAGPLPGHSGSSGMTRVRRLRGRIAAKLEEWEAASADEAGWVARLVTGFQSWDGEEQNSSAVWAARSYIPYVAMTTSERAAREWAVDLWRIEAGSYPQARRHALKAVDEHRRSAGFAALVAEDAGEMAS